MKNTSGTCALVAASDFNAEHFRESHARGAYDSVVAVDGGYAHLRSLGIIPDFALGDFDSLGYVPQTPGVEAFPSHKDESDLELALGHVARSGFAETVVYGALGGRLDHTVAALQICACFAEDGMGVTLVGDGSAVRIVVGPGSFSLPVCDSGVVSVFSATDESVDVSETGMEYTLDKARLSNRTPRGLSNELMGKPARVSVGKGTLYVFYPLC